MERSQWLAQLSEPVLEPELRICDAHHHLWDRMGRHNNRYLLDELLADVGSGHRVASTVYVDCMSMYRADGPEALRPVGETEFAQGVAAMVASGLYGDTRVAAAIVSHVDLTLGERARPVLEAHLRASPNRFRGIRHASSFDDHPDVQKGHLNPPPELLLDARFREGFEQLQALSLSFDAWLYHPQIPELTDLARAFPRCRSCSITSGARSVSGRTPGAGTRSSATGVSRSRSFRSARTWS